MKYIHLYTLLLMLVFHTSCGGQNKPDLPKDNISKGLYSESQVKEAATSKVPMSMVRNVKKARNGDILIASYLGVFRYNARLPDGQGKSFTNLTSKISSPRFSSFWDVLEDRKGNLWFATKDSGVYYYPSTALRAGGKSLSAGQAGFQHFTTKDGLASNMVLHIYEDRAGNIWFGASRYDGKSFRTFTTKDGFPSNNIRFILEDKTGKLWFGSGGNILIYDARLPVGQGKTFTTLTNKDGKAFKNVRCIIEDKKGDILFSNDDGLWRYDGSTFTKISERSAYAIIEDKKGNIWTSSGNSIFRYDQQSLSNLKPTVMEIKVSGGNGNTFLSGILEAKDGSIWVGAGGPQSGVHRYDPRLPDGQGKTFTYFKSAAGQK
ncbi:ligand-binding sensor domain-containing protein [Flavobacterium undicola]|uniref:ligand-binding sensor domain-containing protein n=1 Tax=Flavobacterium undicola TaxID=1932779 RepID=UPI0013783BBD|nr:two-component regulator propeller domain-containing protein [Flavobacterium undicola]MBA0883476.1 histidine kinase [Flavobacterium undicola]